MSEPFLGQIMMVGFNFPPSGWAKCDGQSLPISQNSALFSLFGTFYGGDGETTFALPDLRGRFPLHHHNNGPGLPPISHGTKAGSHQKQLSINEMPNHTHTVRMPCDSEEGNTDDPEGKFPAVKDTDQYRDMSTGVMGPLTCSSQGGGQTFNTMNPYLAINFIVALQGVYPSQ